LWWGGPGNNQHRSHSQTQAASREIAILTTLAVARARKMGSWVSLNPNMRRAKRTANIKAALLAAVIYIPAASAWLSPLPGQAGMGKPHSLLLSGGGGGGSSSSSWTARGGVLSGTYDHIETERFSRCETRRSMESRGPMPQMVFSLPGDPASVVARVAEVGLKLKLVNQEQVKVSR